MLLQDNSISYIAGERWKQIKGYGNKYFISDLGRIVSIKRKTPILLKQMMNNKGYYRVALWHNGYKTYCSVSRLVAEYFVPNDDPIHKTTVDHINSDKSQNAYYNLQWLSLSDNIKKYYTNTKEKASTKDNNKTQLL